MKINCDKGASAERVENTPSKMWKNNCHALCKCRFAFAFELGFFFFKLCVCFRMNWTGIFEHIKWQEQKKIHIHTHIYSENAIYMHKKLLTFTILQEHLSFIYALSVHNCSFYLDARCVLPLTVFRWSGIGMRSNMWQALYSILTFYFRLITFCHAFLPFTKWKLLPPILHGCAAAYMHVVQTHQFEISSMTTYIGFGHRTVFASWLHWIAITQ